MKKNEKWIHDYAESLIEHKIYNTIEEAIAEATRWYKKSERGLQEPLQCPHRPGIKMSVTKTESEYIVNYTGLRIALFDKIKK